MLVGLGCSCGIGSVGFVFPVVVGRCGPEWRLHFWCLWGWVAAVGLEVLSCWVLAGVALIGGSSSGVGGLWNCEVLG